MALEPHVAALVLLAAAMHATWNTLVKTGSDRLLTQALVIGTGAAMAAWMVPFVPLPRPEAWPFVAWSIVSHTGYYAFLVLGYEHGDLSQVYPVARGVAPLLVAALAIPLAGEVLRPIQMGGVVLISAGIVSLALLGRSGKPRETRSLVFALTTGVFIAFYTLVDGIGARRSGSPIGFVVWIFLLDGIPFLAFVLWRRRGQVSRFLTNQWRGGVFGGVIATTGYGIVIWAMARSGLAQVASLRESSVIIAALIGTLLLGESSRGSRVIAAACVAAGNILLQIL